MERFLKTASEEERQDFIHFVKKGNIGISANYLNFNDLVDCGMLEEKTSEMRDIFMREDFRKDGYDCRYKRDFPGRAGCSSE